MTRACLWLGLLACLAGPARSQSAEAQAAYERHDWAQAARLYAQRADRLDRDFYDCLQAARCYAWLGDTAAAVRYLRRTVEPDETLAQLTYVVNEEPFKPLVGRPEWEAFHQDQVRAWDTWRGNAGLEIELQRMASEDQLARARRQMAAVDAANTARLKEIVVERGWPGRDTVGREASEAAWLLLQHSPDKDFQARCLELMRPMLASGQVSAVNFAYLEDRVRVGRGQVQLYGTQLHEVDGQLELFPVDDPAHLEERRASVGLPPMATYLDQVRKMYGKTVRR